MPTLDTTQLRAVLANPSSTVSEVAAALAEVELLLPLVASDGAIIDEELDPEVTKHLRPVDLVGPNGERAVLAFTGLDSLALWHKSARPAPRPVAELARAVLNAQAQAIVIDLAGPHRFVVEGVLLQRLALGERKDEHLAATLAEVMETLRDLPQVTTATLDLRPDEVVISLVGGSDLQVAKVLAQSALAVSLDRPLRVEVTAN